MELSRGAVQLSHPASSVSPHQIYLLILSSNTSCFSNPRCSWSLDTEAKRKGNKMSLYIKEGAQSCCGDVTLKMSLPSTGAASKQNKILWTLIWTKSRTLEGIQRVTFPLSPLDIIWNCRRIFSSVLHNCRNLGTSSWNPFRGFSLQCESKGALNGNAKGAALPPNNQGDPHKSMMFYQVPLSCKKSGCRWVNIRKFLRIISVNHLNTS